MEVPFNYSSRYVFLSDCHRGDGSRADGFARNQALFLYVLNRYYDQGYIYVEVGDSNELWKCWRFEDIRRAHEPVFDLLHRFHRDGRLYLIYGNHDLRNGHCGADQDGVVAHEGLVLRHTRTGQRIFIVHGHQADLKSDRLNWLSRMVVGSIWRRLQLLGVVGLNNDVVHTWKLNRMERAITGWAKVRQQTIICGHTHRPMSAMYGEPSYFNAGSCVFPDRITGLELVHDEISLVNWCLRGGRQGQPLRLERQLMAPARKLSTLT